MTAPLHPLRSQKRKRVHAEDLDQLDRCADIGNKLLHNSPNQLYNYDVERHEPILDLDRDTNLEERDWPSQQPATLPQAFTKPLPRADLTTKNLLLHTQSLDPSAGIIMATPATMTETSGSKPPSDYRLVFREFGAYVHTTASYPDDLRDHLDQIILSRRKTQSPIAADLNRLAKAACQATEATVVSLLAPLLMFIGKLDDPHGGEDYIRLDYNVQFFKRLVVNGSRTLTQPQPDVCLGYILKDHAVGLTQALFSEQEEMILLRHSPSMLSEMLAPFMTGQFKTARADYEFALYQSTGDGIAVDTAMRELYAEAGIRPITADLHHWSLICNGRKAALFVHWSVMRPDGSMRYFSRELIAAHLFGDRINPRLYELREILRNILDYSVKQRVHRIKHVVGRILNPTSDSEYSGSVQAAMNPPQSTPVRDMQNRNQQNAVTTSQQRLQSPSGQGFWSSRGPGLPTIPRQGYPVPPPQTFATESQPSYRMTASHGYSTTPWPKYPASQQAFFNTPPKTYQLAPSPQRTSTDANKRLRTDNSLSNVPNGKHKDQHGRPWLK